MRVAPRLIQTQPNIGSIYGLEEADGVRALVLELIEGATLADRIAQGPIPLDAALPIATQIAEALEAAHEQGVIHRDLKPANIKVKDDGTVKVLDFGLAKAFQAEPGSDPSESPRMTAAATRGGVILGTAAYMAPEQAQGKPVDKRADIWAFGVVLHEMLSGRRLFKGESTADILAAVLTKEIDLEPVPAEVRRLLQKCLEKDPRRRLRDISGVELLLDHGSAISAPVETAPSPSRLTWLWPAAVATLALAAVSFWAPWRSAEPLEDRPLVRLNLDLPGFVGGASRLALSPDGRRIVHGMIGADGVPMLATRLLTEPDLHILPGTEGAYWVFFSADSEWIGFIQGSTTGQNKLRKISVLGGSPFDLADAPDFTGASWGEDGSIVASLRPGSGLSRFPDSGGTPEPVTQLVEESVGHVLPQILPGGEAVLFGAYPRANAIQVVTLASGEIETLIPGALSAKYLPTGGSDAGTGGHIVYFDRGTLFAVPFDPSVLELRGPTVPVLDNLAALPSFSNTGSVLYLMGAPATQTWPVDWLRSSGETETLLETPADYRYPRVSPDGRLLALNKGKAENMNSQVVVYDWQNDTTLLLTQPGEQNSLPTWSPDSQYLAMTGQAGIVWKRGGR